MPPDNPKKDDAAESLKPKAGKATPPIPANVPDTDTPLAAVPSASPPRRLRPAVPVIAQPTHSEPSYTTSVPAAPDDDIIPMPLDALPSQRRATSAPVRKPVPQSLNFRRTLVPILLTLGVLLPALGGFWFFTDDDSPFKLLHIAVPVGLIFLGALMFVLGIFNAMHLGHLLKAKANS